MKGAEADVTGCVSFQGLDIADGDSYKVRHKKEVKLLQQIRDFKNSKMTTDELEAFVVQVNKSMRRHQKITKKKGRNKAKPFMETDK